MVEISARMKTKTTIQIYVLPYDPSFGELPPHMANLVLMVKACGLIQVAGQLTHTAYILHRCGVDLFQSFQRLEHAGDVPFPVDFTDTLATLCHKGVLDMSSGLSLVRGSKVSRTLPEELPDWCRSAARIAVLDAQLLQGMALSAMILKGGYKTTRAAQSAARLVPALRGRERELSREFRRLCSFRVDGQLVRNRLKA